jgi:hypothetical protein
MRDLRYFPATLVRSPSLNLRKAAASPILSLVRNASKEERYVRALAEYMTRPLRLNHA